MANLSHGHITCTQYHVRLKIHPAEKVHRVNSYPDSVETSSEQSQNERYAGNRENQYRTCVPRKFYGQVTYTIQNQAYVFIKNDTIVPIENSMYVK